MQSGGGGGVYDSEDGTQRLSLVNGGRCCLSENSNPRLLIFFSFSMDSLFAFSHMKQQENTNKPKNTKKKAMQFIPFSPSSWFQKRDGRIINRNVSNWKHNYPQTAAKRVY